MQAWTLQDFEILEYINRGKFGNVWKARCKQTTLVVALKVISKEFVLKHSQYQNLKREIEIHHKLCHKHIAQLFGYFHDEFNVYMVLEYYANQNIYYYLKSHRTLSERDVARFKGVLCFRFFLQIVSAVDYMHKRNIIHRDLKLENLFLDEYLNIRVGDLGYAVHTLGQRDTYCGTLSYMTKEQIDQKPYGKEVDIWALGILLFEIALSKSPFLGNEEKETIENVKNHRLIFPEEKSIGPQLIDLIKRLLEPDPEQRITIDQVLIHEWIKMNVNSYMGQ